MKSDSFGLALALVSSSWAHECRSSDGAGSLGPGQMVLSFAHELEYNWNDEHVKQDYLDSGAFLPEVNVITGIKIGNGVKKNPKQTNVFLTVPRWFGGVPSTMNRVVVDLTLSDEEYPVNDPVLEAWPSWNMNKVGDCDALQYTQSMEIDEDGIMWVIDTGRVDIFTEDDDNTCPPKLVWLDTKTGEMVGEPYIFPDSVAPHDSVFLNDIVLDIVDEVAYISDMTGANPDGTTTGGLIVFDRKERKSMRFYHSSMQPEMGLDWKFQGLSLGEDAFANPINGVALTPDRSRLFYSALQQSSHTYSIDTEMLRGALAAGDSSLVDWSKIVDDGPRRSSTDGMTFDCAGNLYHSSLNEASFYVWDSSSYESPLESGALGWKNTDGSCGTWWTDTYAWDDEHYLWLTADYLPDVFVNSTFTNDNIWRFPTKTGSYQLGPCDQSGKRSKSNKSSKSSKNSHCDSKVPNMLGEFYFWGFRLEGVPAANMEDLQSWTEGMGTDGDGVPRPISGLEWVPWTNGPYYMLAINSPAGLVRRFCTFNPWNNRTSTCTGVDYRDEAVTELLEVTEVDEDCNAMAFGIVTTKSFVPGAVCGAGESPPNGDDCTAISNMFVDKVQGVRTKFTYPETPDDIDDFAP